VVSSLLLTADVIVISGGVGHYLEDSDILGQKELKVQKKPVALGVAFGRRLCTVAMIWPGAHALKQLLQQ